MSSLCEAAQICTTVTAEVIGYVLNTHYGQIAQHVACRLRMAARDGHDACCAGRGSAAGPHGQRRGRVRVGRAGQVGRSWYFAGAALPPHQRRRPQVLSGARRSSRCPALLVSRTQTRRDPARCVASPCSAASRTRPWHWPRCCVSIGALMPQSVIAWLCLKPFAAWMVRSAHAERFCAHPVALWWRQGPWRATASCSTIPDPCADSEPWACVECRDLKSNNIMLTGEGVAKIGDVGLAWVRSQGDPNYEFTQAVSCYAAPEAVLGDECTEKARCWRQH